MRSGGMHRNTVFKKILVGLWEVLYYVRYDEDYPDKEERDLVVKHILPAFEKWHALKARDACTDNDDVQLQDVIDTFYMRFKVNTPVYDIFIIMSRYFKTGRLEIIDYAGQ
jgi:hypothetical protein